MDATFWPLSITYGFMMAKKKGYVPVYKCQNKGWDADKLEALVWDEIVKYLGNPDLIIDQLEKQLQESESKTSLETKLKDIEKNLKAPDREQHKLLQWALKGFPEDQVETENQRINKEKELLQKQKVDEESRLKTSKEILIDIPEMERIIREIQDKLPELDFEGKQLALDMLTSSCS